MLFFNIVKKYILILLLLFMIKTAYAENIYYKGVEIPSKNSAIFVPPSQKIIITVKECNKKIVTNWISSKKEGNYSVTINGITKTFKTTAIVGVSSNKIKDGYINDFYLGKYPTPNVPYKHLYKIPSFFYKITENNSELHISNDWTIKELAIDKTESLPQYIAFDYNLLQKLVEIKNELKKRNKPNNMYFIGGMFISPYNNIKRYENGKGMVASVSRHLYGDAVDFIIDENNDNEMDDLNDDGTVDYLDARYLEKLVTSLENNHKCKIGGFVVYAPPLNDHVTVHVDTRGYRARWEFK